MSVIPPESRTPWSQLEGLEIAEAIKKAEASGNLEEAEKLKEIDRRARRRSGDVPPDYDK